MANIYNQPYPQQNIGYQQNYNPYQSPYNYNPYQAPQQRLQALEAQYPQYGQTVQPIQQNSAQSAQEPSPAHSQSPVMSVTNEQQARDYPLDLSGAPMIFVMNDDSKIFAKRFNVSNAMPEFETYEKVSKETPSSVAPAKQDNAFLLSIVGDFSSKLETMYTEIQELRKDIQHGNQLGSDSSASDESKLADENNIGSNSGNGKRGAKSTGDN